MVNNPIQHAKTDIKCVPFYQYYQILTNSMLSKLKNAVFTRLARPKRLTSFTRVTSFNTIKRFIRFSIFTGFFVSQIVSVFNKTYIIFYCVGLL